MISCRDFFNILNKHNLTFFTGIPDSTFKDLMKYLAENDGKSLDNIVACNECEAIAIASGYHLATNNIGIVYMQNSGLGKAVNPLTSLCDPDVYSIPILLMIGWRGEPGKIDAPQHKKMGKITLSLLETLQIPYIILNPDLNDVERELNKALNYFNEHKSPYAFIFRRNFFKEYEMKKEYLNTYELTKKEAIKSIMSNIGNGEIIVSTTGYISRELYEYRESTNREHQKHFYNIGAMGCASSIGLSIALQKPKNKVLVFDGDGAAIMQMGAFTTIGKRSPSNFVHILLDNEVHESTGGQPTNSPIINFVKIAIASNYKYAIQIETKEELLKSIKDIKNRIGPVLLTIKVKHEPNLTLKRPDRIPNEYKEDFMNYLSDLK
ncbi:MAG: phosphonopyruvate decarboxylase [Promethearchaeota archaeon]